MDRFIRSMRLRNLLSFGPDAEEFELEPLNVLIGPNASGKSNVIEAISLLQAAPDDIQEPIRRGGGVSEWLWKGREKDTAPLAFVRVSLHDGKVPLVYGLAFEAFRQGFQIADEIIADTSRYDEDERPVCYFYRREGLALLADTTSPDHPRQRKVDSAEFNFNRSVLAQVKDWFSYSEITSLAGYFEAIRIFGEWHLGRDTEPRKPQLSDLQNDFLTEDARNLALVISDLQNRPGLDERLNEELQRVYPRAQKIMVRILGGTVQLQLHEQGLRDPIPATRMSDGTLRYLCLLSILLHPEPPPLVCIEEPEIGLHPDVMIPLAELMQEASERMQLIVTTHSDALVSALSNVPEAVAVCERDENGSTAIRRLEAEKLGEWLERYTLGDLWIRGELGGVL